MSDWLIEAARHSITGNLPAEERCLYCDGTGDVIRGDGEWLGQCDCDLPEGLIRKSGVLMFECRSCNKWTEWPANIEDFDINAPENVCGGSPRCCP